MKTLVGIMLLVCSSVYASELRSVKIKEQICAKVAAGYQYRIDKKDCMNGTFSILNSKRLEFDNKKYTVAMDIKVDVKGTLIDVKSTRAFDVATAQVSEWRHTIASYELGTFHKIYQASIHDENVVEVEDNEIDMLPQEVLKFVGDVDYAGAIDYASTITYYKIYDNGELIGYIAYQWFDSESQDIKGLVEQSYDINGDKVGDEHIETFGYHE